MLIIVPLTTAVVALFSFLFTDYTLAGTTYLSALETLSIASSAVYTWFPALSASVSDPALDFPFGGIDIDVGDPDKAFVELDVSAAVDYLQLAGQSMERGLWDDLVAFDHMVSVGLSDEGSEEHPSAPVSQAPDSMRGIASRVVQEGFFLFMALDTPAVCIFNQTLDSDETMVASDGLPGVLSLPGLPAFVNGIRLFFSVSAAALVLARLCLYMKPGSAHIKPAKTSGKQASPDSGKVKADKKLRTNTSILRRFFKRANEASSIIASPDGGNISLDESSFVLDGRTDSSGSGCGSVDTTLDSSFGTVSFDSSIVSSVVSSFGTTPGTSFILGQLNLKTLMEELETVSRFLNASVTLLSASFMPRNVSFSLVFYQVCTPCGFIVQAESQADKPFVGPLACSRVPSSALNSHPTVVGGGYWLVTTVVFGPALVFSSQDARFGPHRALAFTALDVKQAESSAPAEETTVILRPAPHVERDDPPSEPTILMTSFGLTIGSSEQRCTSSNTLAIATVPETSNASSSACAQSGAAVLTPYVSFEDNGHQPDSKVEDAVEDPIATTQDPISIYSSHHISDSPQHHGGQHSIIEYTKGARFDASTRRIFLATEDTSSTLCDYCISPEPKFHTIDAKFKKASEDSSLMSGLMQPTVGETHFIQMARMQETDSSRKPRDGQKQEQIANNSRVSTQESGAAAHSEQAYGAEPISERLLSVNEDRYLVQHQSQKDFRPMPLEATRRMETMAASAKAQHTAEKTPTAHFNAEYYRLARMFGAIGCEAVSTPLVAIPVQLQIAGASANSTEVVKKSKSRKKKQPNRAWAAEAQNLARLVEAVAHTEPKRKEKKWQKLNAWRREALASGLITREQAREKRCWAVEARYFGRLFDAVEHELYAEESEETTSPLDAGQIVSNSLSDEFCKSVIARAEPHRERLSDEFIEGVIAQAEARRIAEEVLENEAKAKELPTRRSLFALL